MSLATALTRPVYTSEQRLAWLNAKATLKAIASEIQVAKCHRKTTPHLGVYKGKDAAEASRTLALRYRALHIAMSLLKGKTLGQIEGNATKDGKDIQHRHRWAQGCLDARIKEWQDYFTNPGAKKLYVIVDATLSPSQQAVQSAHAAAKFHQDFPQAPWTNGTLVLLKLTPEAADSRTWYRSAKLTDFTQGLRLNGDYASVWAEPDLGGRVTAVALLSEFRNEKSNGGITGTSLL